MKLHEWNTLRKDHFVFPYMKCALFLCMKFDITLQSPQSTWMLYTVFHEVMFGLEVLSSWCGVYIPLYLCQNSGVEGFSIWKRLLLSVPYVPPFRYDHYRLFLSCMVSYIHKNHFFFTPVQSWNWCSVHISVWRASCYSCG